MANQPINSSRAVTRFRKRLVFVPLCLLLIALFVAIAFAACCPGNSVGPDGRVDWEKRRAALGHEDKFRVLVDKVLSMSNKWIMTEQHMDEIRDAGFNVVVPREGGGDMVRVRRVAEMARKRGMFYMAWMRGTLRTNTGQRLVWEDGCPQDLYSPNADELWDWMTDLILGHACVSVENPAVIGSFLDFENYAKGSQGNCYELSYDEKILSEFAQDRKLDLPDLKPQQRHLWLEDNGLLEAFREFQVNSWRQRCHRLRRQIDAINPRFQLIVYPVGPLFLNEAIYPGWSTTKAPLIIADHYTYGRPNAEIPHAEALELNRTILMNGLRQAKNKKVPVMYMGGIDPVVGGADPEFSGKNAVMISEVTNGYWIFYEGPDYYKPDHAAYFKWFSRANHDIIARKFDLWKQPRHEPDPALAARDKILRQYCGDTARPFSTESMPEGTEGAACTLRDGQAYFTVLLKAGERLTGRLKVKRLCTHTSGASFSLFGPDCRMIDTGEAQIDKPTSVDYVAKSSGVHVITVRAARNPAQLFIDNQYFCLVAVDQIHFLGPQPPLYFLAEGGARQAVLTLNSGSPEETAMMTILDQTGKQVAKDDTATKESLDMKLSVTAGANPEPWSLVLDRASVGEIEDVRLTLGPGCARFLATHPTRLLIRRGRQSTD